MNFLYIEETAVKSLISNSKLQSYEFDEGMKLADFLKKGQISGEYYAGIYFKKFEEGFYLFTGTPNIKNALIFDFNYFKGFEEKRDEDIITIFQKVLRFGVRIWDKMPLSTCEKMATQNEHNLGIVFPFPWVATKGVYRIIIEKNPLQKREEKRDLNYLLVLNDANNEVTIDPNYSLYRRVLENASANCRAVGPNNKVAESQNGALDVHVFEETPGGLDMYMGFDNWSFHLTETQKKFIFKELGGKPERLEGAAGTGKTISMILRCINLLKDAIRKNERRSILFLTHSQSSKKLIKNLLETNFPDIQDHYDSNYSPVYIHVETLQEWCLKNLNLSLSISEVLDRDAQDSKALQLMYLEEAYNEIEANHYTSFKPLLSAKFIAFLNSVTKEELLEMIQFEIAITIKGRAAENIDKYKKISRLKYAIPVDNDIDLGYLFLIFKTYQARLSNVGVFDTDDIILTSLNQLDTPIWRRRKENIGYDVLFIDETHLFNLNELSIFHHLCRKDTQQNIIYAIDKSQAVGDRGLTDEILNESLGLNRDSVVDASVYKTVFRCSPDIVNLAFKILASGATLFTNFENPLERMQYSFSHSDERKAKIPEYFLLESDDIIIEEAIKKADALGEELGTSRAKIIIIATTDEILNKCLNYVQRSNKPVEILKARSDIEIIRSANRTNRYILAHIDYVGGLEFDAALIIGVDKNRVPPAESKDNEDSYHFLNYAWHNRMYVAVTRARYRVIMYGEKSRGESKILESAIDAQMLKKMQ